ncbi:leucine-rich repeat domain-containing protein [Agathobaculum massiliense]|uniref:leucine-rich repeat domain-containing protein n=1 Tax=Agathobaculum massiliense TaxID=3014267 RepID=UPI0036F41794
MKSNVLCKRLISVLLSGAVLAGSSTTAFAAGTGSSEVTLRIDTGDEPAVVSIKVPTEIPLEMDKAGVITVPDDLAIENLSDTTDVDLTALSVTGKNGWAVMDYTNDLSGRPENTKEISMSFRGDGTGADGAVSLSNGKWTISKGSRMPLDIAAKAPIQTEGYSEKGSIAQVNYTFSADGEGESGMESVISNDWDKEQVVKESVTPVSFHYDSTETDTHIESVISSAPELVAVSKAPTSRSLGNPGHEIWNVTAKNRGTAEVVAKLNTGETTSFTVNVYELNTGGDTGDGVITVPGTGDKKPGDDINTGDITIDIPITKPDGSDDTITVTPEIPDDTTLEEGENQIDVTVDVDGVTIHITIVINIEAGNPSDDLEQSEEDAQAMGFTFSPYEDGVQIDSFVNKQGKSEVNVPEKIGEMKVRSIGYSAFTGQSNLKKITLPSTVKTIQGQAFRGCSGLTEFVLGGSETVTVSQRAFHGAFAAGSTLYVNGEMLRQYVVGGDAPFSTATGAKLENVVLSDNVTVIDRRMFDDCKTLKSIKMPAGLKTINESAFQDCTGLESIELPDTLESIGPYAFSGCGKLRVELPQGSSLKTIDHNAFTGCTAMEEIIIPSGVTYIGAHAFRGCTGVKQLVIPEGITTIANDTFSGLNLIKEIVIPDSVTSIGANAFSGCMSAEEVTIGAGVEELGYSVFAAVGKNAARCVVSLRSAPEAVYTNPPFERSGVTEAVFMDGITKIGSSLFHKAEKLDKVTLPATVTEIESYAFDGCKSLELTVPDSVTSIGSSAFKDMPHVYYNGPASGSPWGAAAVN